MRLFSPGSQLTGCAGLRVGEVLSVGLGQTAAALGALFGIRLLTGFLDPTAYGRLALALTLVTLVQQTTAGPVSHAAARFLSPALEGTGVRPYIGALCDMGIRGLAAVTVIAVLVISLVFAAHRSDLVLLTIAAIVFALITGTCSILDSVQTAARHRAVVAWHQSAGQWLRYLAALTLVRGYGASTETAMVGLVLGSVPVLFSQWRFFRNKVFALASAEPRCGSSARVARRKEMVAYSWPFTMWGVLGWVQFSVDRWVLEVFQGTSHVGHYQALFQIGYYPLALVSGFVTQVAYPWLFAQAGDGSEPGRVRAATTRVMWVTGLMLALTAALATASLLEHRRVFALVAAPRYGLVSGLLPLVVLSSGIFFAGQMLNFVPLIRLSSRALLAPKIGTAVLALAADPLGAYCMGLKGVVLGNLATSTAYAIWMCWVGRRVTAEAGRCQVGGARRGGNWAETWGGSVP